MLPSRGFFKKNDCPFFEKGLCVRPHCHFRHKKKVVSENSSSLDSQEDLLILERIPDIQIGTSINNESVPVLGRDATETQHSNNGNESKEDQSSSLFAKLVNQSNPYEKISRHIPCAYTPTPQVRTVQPKTSALQNSTISFETIIKPSSFLNNCSKGNNSEKLGSSKNENLSVLKNNLSSDENSKISCSFKFSKLKSKDNEYKIPLLENKLSYEPQPAIKIVNSGLHQNETDGGISNYVPSKITTTESKYSPDSNDSSLPSDYVPSKDKPECTQYIPQSNGGSENEVTYTPSDKTSKETLYQPAVSKDVAEYVPTEKSATKTSTPCKDDITEFEFISSEIEMMKELLKDEINENKVTADGKEKKKLSEEKEKNSEEKDKIVKNHHQSSSSRHRTGESSSHSLKSKHSSSSSSKHKSSQRHSSKSSTHHSSSKTSKSSSSHSSSSKTHKRSISSPHKSSRHHRSHHSPRSRSKEKKHHTKDSKKGKKEIEHLEKGKSDKTVLLSSDDNSRENVEELTSNQEKSLDKKGSDTESESDCKKRKSSWKDDDDKRKLKLLKKSEEILFDDLDDPDTIEQQCLEIFNSYSVCTNETLKRNEISIPTEEFDSAVLGNKRTAHSATLTSDHSVLRQKTMKKSNVIKSAQDVMLERYKAIEKVKETPPGQHSVQPAPIFGLNKPSIRIAAVSNIQQMLQAKKAIQEQINKGLKVNERTTIAHTVARGSSRIAHTPANKEMIEKPTVSGGSKQIPTVKRQIYLDKLLLETYQIYPTKGEAVEEALKLEEEIFRANSGSLRAYHAAFVSMLLRTRRRITAVKGETSRTNVPRLKMSHSDVLAGGKKNFSIIKTKKVDLTMLSDRHIYEELLRCKLTPEALKENGYPMDKGKPGYASCSINFDLKYNDKYIYIKKMNGNRRYCIRCSKQYEVDPKTLKQYKEGPETCCYHPGKKKSGGRNFDRIYNCCNSASPEGCATHVRHVTDCNNYENLPNCVKTLPKDEANPGVFALDCEMVYTRMGYELARVTVVNLKKEIVYDTLVKPRYPIECYNTFYSGIEEKMMEGVETTLKDVQAVLLSMFSNKTILIGHSLDSDLRALHLIHDTVVDTAVVYKNEKYHPYKYSLKDLCARKISKIIQDNVGGHDSAEDAVAALEIMLNHVKEEVGKFDSLESYEADRAT